MDYTELRSLAEDIEAECGKVIIGKQEQIRLVLTSLFAGGHVLIDDIPGVGKTTLVKALAAVLDLVEGYPGEGTLYIGLLELEAQFHRQGLGTQLVRALKTAAQKAGFSSLRLGCYERNAPGLAFWNAMGFEKEGEVLREGRALYKMHLSL